MENCKLNNKWNEIQNLNWYDLAKSHKTKNANASLARILMSKYTTEEIAELLNFVIDKRRKMCDFIYQWLDENNIKGNVFRRSDDGIWDLSSHIVGLGYSMYETVLKHPTILLELQNDYVENFEYGFDEAIYKMANKDI